MSDVPTERLERYVLDGGNDDLQRLLTIAQVTEAAARAACERIGATNGWSAIDCGCGPLGALSVLARVVGPKGSVVGVDFNEASIHTAGAAIAALGLRNVELVPHLHVDAGEGPPRAITDTLTINSVAPPVIA